ncbi:zinc-binding dehydrogenase [Burkholderia sp. JKS000303]|uniref:zinc-binding dehydrogenase n=1 Tax=Burkholderia sp. JKS000303 TaxID=1938747 RepID=UPI000BFA7E97|nr:zinc-binding dehydrogenase [Burkholderia sp. JKS000303]PFH19347.1 NADPH:quinone reductase-like Zn-dependent oxidoreductase [Burkholderia sp. JKS000303]
MKAAFITGHGGNEVVEVGERPRPARSAGNVLISLKAATLNRVDLYMRDSGAGITHRLPQIMGIDGAGTIEAVDESETRLSPGQHVVVHPGIGCGRCEYCLRGESVLCMSIQYLGEHRDGTLAQYVSVPATNVFPMPAALDFAEAAALGVGHLTAWRMLFTKAALKPWETVLIFGVGGGVSLVTLQLAKLAGSRAIVTSRDDTKLQRAVSMGADHAINGATQDVVKTVMALTDGRGVDVVIENVGASVWASALKSVARGGRIVTCGATTGDQPPADLRRIFIRQLQIFGSTLGTLDEYRDLLALTARGGLRPVIDSRYPLDDVHAALDRLASGAQFGKVAIEIDA